MQTINEQQYLRQVIDLPFLLHKCSHIHYNIPTMRRRHFISGVLLCLVLGVITTVAVAWGCSYRSFRFSGFYNNHQFGVVKTSYATWSVSLQEGIGAVLVSGIPVNDSQLAELKYIEFNEWPAVARNSLLQGPALVEIPTEPFFGVYGSNMSVYAAGWPLPAFRCEIVTRLDLETGNVSCKFYGGIDRALSHNKWSYPRAQPVIPLTPLWPELILDSMLFALLWLPIVFLYAITIKTVISIRKRNQVIIVSATIFASFFTTVSLAWIGAIRNDSDIREQYASCMSVNAMEALFKPPFVTVDVETWCSGSYYETNWIKYSSATSGTWPLQINEEVLPSWVLKHPAMDKEGADKSVVLGTGWPFAAMHTSYERKSNQIYNLNYNVGKVADGILIDDGQSTNRPAENARILPLGIIPLGFAVDSLLYVLVWFPLLMSFSSYRYMKSTLRIKRGKCPKCAYNLRGDFDNGCPECGWGRGGMSK